MKSIAYYVYEVMDKSVQVGEKISRSTVVGRLPNEANPISDKAVSSELAVQIRIGLLKKVKRGLYEKLTEYPPRHFSTRRDSVKQSPFTDIRPLVALALQSAADWELLAEVARRMGQ